MVHPVTSLRYSPDDNDRSEAAALLEGVKLIAGAQDRRHVLAVTRIKTRAARRAGDRRRGGSTARADSSRSPPTPVAVGLSRQRRAGRPKGAVNQVMGELDALADPDPDLRNLHVTATRSSTRTVSGYGSCVRLLGRDYQRSPAEP